MHRCVSLLLCASALVLCISGAPLKADADRALDHLVQKLESARLRPSAVDAPLMKVDKEADMDTESKEEEADSVERAYYPSYAPSYQAPYGGGYGSPYSAPYGGGYGYPSQGSSQGGSQGGFQSPYQAPYMPPNNPYEVTNPAFHATTSTTAAQKMSSQGNANSYGTIAADSYDSYHPTSSYRRRRAAELEAAADQVAEKLAKIVKAEAMKVDAEGALDEVDDKVNEKVERDFGYGSPYQPSPYGSNYYAAPAPYGSYYPAPAPYGNSYQAPYAAPYGGNSYHAPAGPDSAKVEQAAASTKSLYMSGGTSSTRPAPYNPYAAPSQTP